MCCLCFIFDLSTMAQEQKSLEPPTSLELVKVAARPMSLKTRSKHSSPRREGATAYQPAGRCHQRRKYIPMWGERATA